MALIRNGAVVDDAWTAVADDDELPDAPAIVTLDRWRADHDALNGREAPYAVTVSWFFTKGATYFSRLFWTEPKEIRVRARFFEASSDFV